MGNRRQDGNEWKAAGKWDAGEEREAGLGVEVSLSHFVCCPQQREMVFLLLSA